MPNPPATTDNDGYARVAYPNYMFERIETGTLCLSEGAKTRFVGRKVVLKPRRKRPFFGADLKAVHVNNEPGNQNERQRV